LGLKYTSSRLPVLTPVWCISVKRTHLATFNSVGVVTNVCWCVTPVWYLSNETHDVANWKNVLELRNIKCTQNGKINRNMTS